MSGGSMAGVGYDRHDPAAGDARPESCDEVRGGRRQILGQGREHEYRRNDDPERCGAGARQDADRQAENGRDCVVLLHDSAVLFEGRLACPVAFVALLRAQVGERVGDPLPQGCLLFRVLGLRGGCCHLGVDEPHGAVVNEAVHFLFGGVGQAMVGAVTLYRVDELGSGVGGVLCDDAELVLALSSLIRHFGWGLPQVQLAVKYRR
ncbi:hypothetical protein [Microbacterium sp.]|uniref:hypothetical protein n=1 Tax=Microbacterium sp. TaxID=51671 RepID=UPI003F9B549F